MSHALLEGRAVSGLDLRQARHSGTARALLVERSRAGGRAQPVLHIRHEGSQNRLIALRARQHRRTRSLRRGKLFSTRWRGERILAQPRRANHLHFGIPVQPSREKYCCFRFSEICGSCLAIPPRQEGRIAIVMNVRWGAVAATARETSAPVADGEAVWFWRPEAGVKFARCQRIARMTGSTKRWSPGRARSKP